MLVTHKVEDPGRDLQTFFFLQEMPGALDERKVCTADESGVFTAHPGGNTGSESLRQTSAGFATTPEPRASPSGNPVKRLSGVR